MKLDKIISVSGKPGLYRLVSQSKGGFIVEDLNTAKKTSISAQNQVSLLDNISIYTYEEDIPLGEVFDAMSKKYKGEKGISHKSSEKELREEMDTILPEYDEERVYGSDLKKLFQWYNTLAENGLMLPGEEESQESIKGEEE